jgi:two-component system invasion response regulator UvrY
MIKVALVDDHKLLRNGLSNFINNHAAFEVVFEADNGIDLQQKMKTMPQTPEVVLMDINMPLMDGYESTAWLTQTHPEVKVLALSMYDSEEAIIKMLRQGAKGYLLKDSEPDVLLKAITETYNQGFYYTPMVLQHINALINTTEKDTTLTPRELELLRYMTTEMTYKEIADAMFISPKTLENHREKLCDKLKLKTRIGLVMYAVKHKLVPL